MLLGKSLGRCANQCNIIYWKQVVLEINSPLATMKNNGEVKLGRYFWYFCVLITMVNLILQWHYTKKLKYETHVIDNTIWHKLVGAFIWCNDLDRFHFRGRHTHTHACFIYCAILTQPLYLRSLLF